ncbi:MAG: WYL domain-containing protein [Clostridia bacterium]|nr:WYL domain-containing protein [Clostridia bacterium]
MPKQANQKIKILYLMKIFYEHTDREHGLTLAQIAQALAEYRVTAERKTLYDDIEVLREYGMDIAMRRGAAVEYYVKTRDFELPELKLLVDAVQSSKFITVKKSSELIRKLESFSSRYQASQLQRQVKVINRVKTMNESVYTGVDRIHEAIGKGQCVSFFYFDWTVGKEKRLRHDGKRYVVSPWELMWDDEKYYLIAFDDESGTVKHYRVDKMEDVRTIDRPRTGQEALQRFDAAIYSKKTFGMYGGREETVRLCCQNDLAGVMFDRFGMDTMLIPADAEHFDMLVNVHISPPFFAWLLNFGDRVQIVSPAAVREEFGDLLHKTAALYE